jgi:membrane fusion protein, type I secretion system
MDRYDVSEAVNGEQKQLETRRLGRAGQRSQLKERIVQLYEEITGYESQIGSKVRQGERIVKELEGVNKLWATNLIPYSRVTSLEREKERLEGERGVCEDDPTDGFYLSHEGAGRPDRARIREK